MSVIEARHLAYDEPFPGLPARDNRPWVVSFIVVGLIMAGLVFSVLTRSSLREYSYSARVSFIYVPAAFVLILMLGWSQRLFPVAAGLFYAYLGIAQATSAKFYLYGDSGAAITLEMLLALPIIAAGLLGASGHPSSVSRRTPKLLYYSFAFILLSGFISMALAPNFGLAWPTYLGRHLLPLLVTLGVVRRCRTIDDYQVIWWGFVLGMLAIASFDFRRAVLGVEQFRSHAINQRSAGASLAYANTVVAMLGGALWLGQAKAVEGKLWRAIFWMLIVGVICILIWLGAHRGPVVAIALLFILWFPKRFLRHIFKPSVLLMAIVGSIIMTCVVYFVVEQTSLDVGMIIQRLQQLMGSGITGTSRWAIWSEGMRHWLYSPLWGAGLNQWTHVNRQFLSTHSSVVGIFFDLGLLGVMAFAMFIYATGAISGKRYWKRLDFSSQWFYLGCRAAWVVSLMLLGVTNSFTSGQPRNNIFAYVVYFFPALALVVCKQEAAIDETYLEEEEMVLDYEAAADYGNLPV